ncbi:flavin reductase family protein [Streptococcus suis]|uniref:flavin reductase family protein n=1 Tax=Streptococcus suis TaxID=1307 RepID=UPI000CF5B328|nr:flavin reductase family protein [Streptococcus suis]
MKRTFETRKLYFGFPVFFLGYKDDVHGYNMTTSSSVYSLGSMVVIGMWTMGNEVTEIRKHGHFTVNILREDLLEEVEIAGFNSRKDKFSLTGLTYSIGETVDAPLVNKCPISIECEVVELVECGKLTNIIGKVTRRLVEANLLDENGDFKGHEFSQISYIGDGSGRHYRYYCEDSLRMGSFIPKFREKISK